MGNFTGIGKLPSELTEKTNLTEGDIVITGSGAGRTTWKNIFEKISFSGLLTTAKNIVGAINELNTKFVVVTATRSITADAKSYCQNQMYATIPSGYTVISCAVHGLGNRQGSYDPASGILTVYNQGGSSWTTEVTVHLLCSKN